MKSPDHSLNDLSTTTRSVHKTCHTVTTRVGSTVTAEIMAIVQLFVEYYKKQGVVPEGQWDEFMEVLKTPLPTTFRINGTGKFATDLRDKLESDFLSNFNKDPIMVCALILGALHLAPHHSVDDAVQQMVAELSNPLLTLLTSPSDCCRAVVTCLLALVCCIDSTATHR